MKLIKQWKDTKYNVENFLYENKDGFRVLHTINNQSLDTFASLAINAGAYFEKDLEVPNGTAHFLEHIVFNPNYELTNQKEIDAFEFGTKDRARLILNASTGFRNMRIYGYCHNSRESDLLKRLSQVIGYPQELMKKYLSKERKIILAELQHELKPEHDSILQLSHFIFDEKVHNTDFNVLGKDAKTIKSINEQHLIKFYKSQFTINNSYFSIQSPNKLSEEVLNYIDTISQTLKKNGNNNGKVYEEFLEDEKKVGFFHNTQSQGFSTVMFRFQNDKSRVKDYRNDLLNDLRVALIKHVGFNYLREKKGYIYNLSSFSSGFHSWDYSLVGFEITTDLKNFKEALIGLNEVIYKKSIQFIKTPQGVKWFENYISSYLFPRTVGYIDDYSQGKSFTLLNGYELFDFEKAKDAIQKITISELREYIEIENSKSPYSYWVDSPEKKETVRKEVKKIGILKGHKIN